MDWQVADGEDKASWETLVNRLWERGLRPENGLQAVMRDGCGKLGEALALVYGARMIEQRCIFHKLRMSPTSVMGNSKAMLTSQHESSCWSKRVRSIKPRVPPMPERGWPPLPTRGKAERQKR